MNLSTHCWTKPIVLALYGFPPEGARSNSNVDTQLKHTCTQDIVKMGDDGKPVAYQSPPGSPRSGDGKDSRKAGAHDTYGGPQTVTPEPTPSPRPVSVAIEREKQLQFSHVSHA